MSMQTDIEYFEFREAQERALAASASSASIAALHNEMAVYYSWQVASLRQNAPRVEPTPARLATGQS